MSERFGVSLYKQNFNFASAHFLIFGDGRREELHGHNYYARIVIEGPLQIGDVVADFIVVKPIVRACCAELDHRVILPTQAEALTIDEGEVEVEVRVSDGSRFVFPRRDVVLLPIPNTSTERLAQLLSSRILERLRAELPGLSLARLRVEVEESGGQSGWCEVEPRREAR